MGRQFKIMLLPGDGIGPEITGEAVTVLEAALTPAGHGISWERGLAGGIAIDETGQPLEPGLIERCRQCDAVLLGAVGGPKWETTDPAKPRPEQGLLALRKELALYANLRPVKVFRPLVGASSLKPEVVDGIDIMVVRELTGGLYFGESGRKTGENGDYAFDTMIYDRSEIERIARLGFQLAAGRSGRLCSVDKANVLESSRLWREVVLDMAGEFPAVELTHHLVDNAAMQLVRNPGQYDVMVTENMFGDILSDEAAMLTGSIGMLPSASLGAEGVSLYEPIHGSAPDIAGKDLANPIAMVLSGAMMLRHSLGLEAEAAVVETAVERVLEAGHRTADISAEGEKAVGTAEMGSLIAQAL